MAEVEALPMIGVLKRTLIKSPVIKSIIPARILHASHNDVIFVRSDSIEVKAVIENYPNPYLQDIICKADFDSDIRSARILGRPRTYQKVEKSEENVLVEEDKPPRTPYRQPSFIPPEIPPHILALTLESSKLIFLCAFYDWTGHPQWLSSYRVLPNHAHSYSKRLGEHIAVDPKSRAMAVAANESCFALYALKSMDQLREEVETVVGLQSTNFDPITDERFILVDGVIVKIEFLHSSRAGADEVILLVISAKKQKTKLHIYVWNSSTNLRQARELGSGQRVPDDEQLPLLLIPLTMSTAFMLVFQEHITVYTGILTGPATPHRTRLRHWEEPEQPGSSRDLPIFTQWARAMRRDDRVSVQDNIYLCREDGVIRFLEISDSIRCMIESDHNAGHLNVNIDTAFASLDLGARCNDLLVAGGDLSSGGLWFFEPRQGARLTSTIPNWTPMIDIAVTKVHQQSPSASAFPTAAGVQNRMRVFASIGRGETHGEITEIRYGIEGAIVGEIESVGNAVTGIWALHDSSGKSVHILVSSPTDTTPLLINSDSGALPDADPQIDINSDAKTIAAGLTTDGCIVQVTPSAIVVASPLHRRHRLAVSMEREAVTSGSILTSDTYGCVLLITKQTEAGNYLQCTRVRTDSEDMTLQHLGGPVALPAEASCSSLQEIQGQICAFIGTNTGSLLVFNRIHGGSSSLQMTFKHVFEGDTAVCDSIATVIDEDQHWLVCGLRNGVSQTFSLAAEGRVLLTPLESFVLGSTSVSIKADGKQQSRAVIACGEIFCTLEYTYEQPQRATIRNILLTNEESPGYGQDLIIAFTQAAHWPVNESRGFAAGQWFCMEADNFHLVELQGGSQSAMIPRRMYLDGTPTRVTYSDKLDKLIVLYTRIVIRRDPHHGLPGQRAMEQTFAFLDTDRGLLRPDQEYPANNELRVELANDRTRRANVTIIQERKPGEKFLGMTEWFPTDGDKVYHMLVIFTMIQHQDRRDPTGRLLFFSLSKNGNGQVSMTFKKITELRASVSAVVPYGKSSLIYSCGNDICLHTLELTSTPRVWLPPVILTLQSRGVHLSVNGHFIDVTTAADSLSVLKVDNDNRNLTLLRSDEIARYGISHLDIPALSLVITSSKDGTITGLQRAPRQRVSNSLTTAFVADFPGSITRLRRINRPSWQLNESSKASRLGAESIIACTADGSLYQIDILEESSWRLLRFIVNMAKRHPLICPYRERLPGMIDSRYAQHEPATTNKRFMQVDGNILTRLLERGGHELLRDIVSRERYGDEAIADFETAAARSHRFWELAQDAGVDAQDFSAVVDWIRGMVVSVL